MRKPFTFLLILVFILGLAPINFSTAITQSQIDAEVQIVCTDGVGNWFSGSGTIIDPKGIILTNRHVIEGAYKNTCFIGFLKSINQEPDFGTKSNRYLAEVKYYTTTKDMDAAVLYLENKSNSIYPYINIWDSSSASLKFGDKIEVIGFPSIGGSTITYTSGDFSGFGSKNDGTQNYIKSTAPLEHGNSGGASYNSSGQFIGIPSMVISGELNSLSYILSIDSIKNWLSDILDNGYKQKIIEQKPVIIEPSTNIEQEIKTPVINDISLYYSAHEGDRIYGNRQLYLPYSRGSNTYTFANNISFMWALWKDKDLDGFYYYFGKDPLANPITSGKYITNGVGIGEYNGGIENLIDEGDYYIILRAKDKSNNISDNFIYKIHYFKFDRKYLKKLNFYSDSNYKNLLKSYEINIKQDLFNGGSPFFPEKDAFACSTNLDNLYFSWDYNPLNYKEFVILKENQAGDINFYSNWIEDNSYSKTKLADGNLLSSNRSSIEKISNGESFDLSVTDNTATQSDYQIHSYDSKEGVHYEFYMKPYISDLKVSLEHRLFGLLYDPNQKDNIVCKYYNWQPECDSNSCTIVGNYSLKNLTEYSASTNNFADLESVDNQFANRLKGKILLQVESRGEAYYVYPEDSKRYYLGRPTDAFNVMKKLGLGATHDFIKSQTIYPQNVLGKILIDVGDNGRAYYIYPKDKKAYYLGRPADAFRIMRELGLGITNADLSKIPLSNL